jgi:hypothetical protein
MRKILFLFLAFAVVALLVGVTSHLSVAKKDYCVTIQDGTLLRSDGVPIVVGYDEWGYNYQAHMFNGYYCDSYRNAAWCQPYKDTELIMKWNDAWLSNKDCGTQVGEAQYTNLYIPDGNLDRHYPIIDLRINNGK